MISKFWRVNSVRAGLKTLLLVVLALAWTICAAEIDRDFYDAPQLSAAEGRARLMELDRTLQATKTEAEIVKNVETFLNEEKVYAPFWVEIGESFNRAPFDLTFESHRRRAQAIRNQIGLMVTVMAPAKVADVRTAAAAIKADPAFKIKAEPREGNWLSNAVKRVWEAIQSFLDRFRPKNLGSSPRWQPDLSFMAVLGQFLKWGIIILLGVGVLIFLAYAIKSIAGRKSAKRKSRAGLLDDGEEVKTQSEYLEEAEELARRGDYRGAVRAYYLACLLRIDETRIARFDPSETNWEHLRRIERSTVRPEDFGFRAETKLFDLVWYGKIVRGPEDVDVFRQCYVRLTAFKDSLEAAS